MLAAPPVSRCRRAPLRPEVPGCPDSGAALRVRPVPTPMAARRHAQSVDQYLSAQTPPSAPEINPMKHIWGARREKFFRNRVFKRLDALKTRNGIRRKIRATKSISHRCAVASRVSSAYPAIAFSHQKSLATGHRQHFNRVAFGCQCSSQACDWRVFFQLYFARNSC